MHGTYRFIDTDTEFRVFGHLPDVEGLAASFPDYRFRDFAPTRAERWNSYALRTAACVMALALGELSPNLESPVPAPLPSPRENVAPADTKTVPPVASPARILTVAGKIASDAGPVAPAPNPQSHATLTAEASPIEVALPTDGAEALFTGAPAGVAADGPTAREAPLVLNRGGKTHLVALIDGRSTGEIEFADAGGTVSVRLASLLSLVADRFPSAEYARLAGSPAADSFVAIDQLAEAGIDIRYDPIYDEIRLDTQGRAVSAGDQSQSPSEYS